MSITQMYEYPVSLALRDFDPAYVRCGSLSTFSTEATRPFMSAMPPIATVSVRRNEPSRRANKRHMQCSKSS
jgi:hypothetical protein